MNLQIIAYKTEFGDWAFDHEHQNTVAEPLCNGTELVLDEYFRIDMNRNPKINDQIQIIVDTEDFENSTTVLQLESTNDEGSNYLDMVLFEKVWLCPWIQSYFGYVPSELYVQLNPVNPGKIAFEKTMRTGVNPFTKYLKTSSFNENVSGISRECSNC
jgi:hypothetical protein